MEVKCSLEGTNRLFINNRYYLSFTAYDGVLSFLAIRDKTRQKKIADCCFQTGINSLHFKDSITIYERGKIAEDFVQLVTSRLSNHIKIEYA